MEIPNHVKFEQGEMWNAAFLNSQHVFCYFDFLSISEIMGKLVKEGLLSKGGKDTYTINKQEVFSVILSHSF